MKFVFDEVVATRTEPTVSINPRGAVHFNMAATSFLNPSPSCRVTIIYDDETQELAFKLDPNGRIRVDSVSDGKASKFFSKTFVDWLEQHGIVPKRYSLTWDEKEKQLIAKVEVKK